MNLKSKPIVIALLVLILSFMPLFYSTVHANNFDISTGPDGVELKLGGDIAGQEGAWGKLTSEAQFAVTGISAIAVLICVASLIIGFSMMATANGNPNKLSTAKTAIMFGFIGIAGIGAVWVIAGLAFNLFSS